MGDSATHEQVNLAPDRLRHGLLHVLDRLRSKGTRRIDCREHINRALRRLFVDDARETGTGVVRQFVFEGGDNRLAQPPVVYHHDELPGQDGGNGQQADAGGSEALQEIGAGTQLRARYEAGQDKDGGGDGEDGKKIGEEQQESTPGAL
jgi:hypothetical protein